MMYMLMLVWQDPYVEVIRYALAHHRVGIQQLGDVEQVRDAFIRKQVLKIRGAIAATNYFRIPRDLGHGTIGLGLTGRYIYIQVQL